MYATPPRQLARFCDGPSHDDSARRPLPAFATAPRVTKRTLSDADETNPIPPYHPSLAAFPEEQDEDETMGDENDASPLPPIRMPRDIRPLRKTRRVNTTTIVSQNTEQEPWRTIDFGVYAKRPPD